MERGKIKYSKMVKRRKIAIFRFMVNDSIWNLIRNTFKTNKVFASVESLCPKFYCKNYYVYSKIYRKLRHHIGV